MYNLKKNNSRQLTFIVTSHSCLRIFFVFVVVIVFAFRPPRICVCPGQDGGEGLLVHAKDRQHNSITYTTNTRLQYSLVEPLSKLEMI